MKYKILEHLRILEEKHNIKILFAVESGSRVWRLESKDSDFDVRFVFIREKKDYIRINQQADVIQILDKENNIDIVGFDIYKFSKLLLSSNPSMIEWLLSDIVYLDDEITKITFLMFIRRNFNPLALYHHYRSMCKQNYMKYLKSREMLTYKKYLYVMRGFINAEIVRKDLRLPNIDFNIELDLQEDNLVTKKLKEIIIEKKTGKEKDEQQLIDIFDTEIENFLKEEKEVESKKIKDFSEIQNLIFKLLEEK